MTMKRSLFISTFAVLTLLSIASPSVNPQLSGKTEQQTESDDDSLTFDANLLDYLVDRYCSKGSPCFGSVPVEHDPILDVFSPTYHFTQQLDADRALLAKMRPLFFEKRDQGFLESTANALLGRDPDDGRKGQVYKRAIQEYGGREVMLLTEDDFRISSLYFKRDNAPLNIIFVAGYFRGNTPTKEWAAPFAPLLSDCNILTFDWRGYAESSGTPSEFTGDAYKDIQAAIDFIRADNDKPVVVIGFCLGAAIALRAICEAQTNGKNLPDAIVLNSVPTHVEHMRERASRAAPNWVLKYVFSYRIMQNYVLERMMGDLFELSPIEMIRTINLPIHFEYYHYDKMIPFREGVENFLEAPHQTKSIMLSELGGHVRTHSKVPYQYATALYAFFHNADLVDDEQHQMLQASLDEHAGVSKTPQSTSEATE